MKINSINTTTPFKGYDARPLKGFIMSSNCEGVADEVYKIGQKEGFKLFASTANTCREMIPIKNSIKSNLWAQDYWTIVKNKLLAFNPNIATCAIQAYFNLKDDANQLAKRAKEEKHQMGMSSQFSDSISYSSTSIHINNRAQRIQHLHNSHIAGGNIFIIKNDERECAFIGDFELEKYNIEDIQKMYNVNDVIVLPQMDYHLDLFIRPLNNGRVLLADDNMTLAVLKKSLNKIPKDNNTYTLLKNFICSFQLSMENNMNPDTDEIEEILQNKGFQAIRVPARIYKIENSNQDFCLLSHFTNYINANVLPNKNGDLVYITNKSNLDTLSDLSPLIMKTVVPDFEKSFVDAVSNYIKPEHIYFVSGDDGFISRTLLPGYQGGIHCMCAEVPDE